MKKYISAIAGTLFFVGLIALAANLSSSDSEIDFFNDESNYGVSSYIEFPSMNINANTVRNWTGSYWNYSQYNLSSVYIRKATLIPISSGYGSYSKRLYITYDAHGNSSYSKTNAYEYNLSAEAWISGPNGYISVYGMNDLKDLSVYEIAEFLRLYCKYVVQPRLDSPYFNNITKNNSSYNYSNSSYNSSRPSYYNYSNSSSNYYNNYSRYNYTNSTSYNTSNRSSYYVPEPIYGSTNLTVRLPAQNISWGNMSIYVYNATFYGNSTSSNNYRGRVYAKFNVNASRYGGWYGYYDYFYAQDIIYDAFSAYSCNEYYNYGLIPNNNDTLRDILFNYYWNYAKPAIVSTISNSINNTTNTTQYLPNDYITAANLTSWFNASWWTFLNYSSVGYYVNIWNANFTGTVGKYDTNGRIRVTFDAYGNNSYTPSYNQSQTWESRVGATIDVYNSWVSSITFDRQLAILPSDLRNFLRIWVTYRAIPYLIKNSSNTTGPVFPEYNITGFDLNSWIQQYNAYPNYTWAGYYVYVYNFRPSLQQYNNTVFGNVSFSLIAFGNDTAYPCWGWSCPQIKVYSNASMTVYVDGDRRNNTGAWYSIDYNLRVNYTDIYNFLRGYFYGVMVPNITSYYNLTNGTTPNRTIYLPNYYNDSQINIDCSRQHWYCSGAHTQSYLSFLGARGYNLSITVDQRGNGYFNGALDLPYIANLINFTSTYYGKETIVDNLQGNASINLFGWVNGTGNNSYYVTLDNYAYASVIYDRNYFVQNAVLQLYSEKFRWSLQYFVNSIVSNRTRNYYY